MKSVDKERVPLESCILYTLKISRLAGFITIWIFILLFSYNPAQGQNITGTVYRDYNANASQDAIEPGLEGLSLTAYVADGTSYGPVSTDASGHYNLPVPSSTSVRIELTNAPSYLFPGAYGGGSMTNVIFATSPASGMDIGLNEPVDYCHSTNPDIATPCFILGEYDGGGSAETALVTVPYNASGHDFDTSSPPQPTAGFQGTSLATSLDIGATYGAAFQRFTDRIYVGAFLKRYSGFGPNGPDAIYVLDSGGTGIGVIELDALLGGSNTAGSDPHDLSAAQVMDTTSFPLVGRLAFGDLEISGDMQTLYVVNLFDRRIYAIDVADGIPANATLVDSWSAPDATGAGRHRPFALAWHNGVLWVGSVDENGTTAYVHSFDPNPTSNPGEVFNLEVTVDLTYQRQAYMGDTNDQADRRSNWNAWTTSLGGITYMSNGSGQEIAYPQPMLTDIEFDREDMILGFRDRFGDQSAANERFRSGDAINTWGTAAGDILRACYTGGSYTVETGTTGACASSGGFGNSGPGGAEYYHWDIWEDGGTWDPATNGNAFHWEVTQGGLLQLRSLTTIMTTTMDPVDDFSGGVLRLENATGRREGVGAGDTESSGTLTGGYTLFDTGQFNGDPPINQETYAKGNGLGDIEAFCEPTPLEIGDRLWCDLGSGVASADENGVQDPGEAGIGGVDVTLTCDTNTSGTIDGADASATIQSASSGQVGAYLFTDAIWDTAVNPGSAGDLIPRNTLCRITVDTSDITGGVCSANLTSLNNGGGDAAADNRDSDGAILSGGETGIEFTTGFDGENNHSYDIGFGGVERDFGDAPDSYGTSGGDNDTGGNEGESASHIVVDHLRLGACIDSETDGQDSSMSDGDDTNAGGAPGVVYGTCTDNNDEDGIDFTATNGPMAPACTVGNKLNVTVLNSVIDTVYVHGWLDYNLDGDFDDPAERMFTREINSSDPNPRVISITYDVPCDAIIGNTVARFRLSPEPNILPTGALDEGEVEDYLFMIKGDFGDLPDGTIGGLYPTTLADDGPRHVIVPNCYLGATVDFEADGSASSTASGDDDTVDDEDGIFFLTEPFDAGATETVLVTFNDAGCSSAVLYCWADFDGDGDLLESPIADGHVFNTSPDTLNFVVPDPLSVTQIFVRCRMGTTGANIPTGQVNDGEVEDYVVDTSLPVELEAFEVEITGREAVLTWRTISEQNNAGFVIEKRWNSDSYNEVAFINGHGTTEAPQVYSYTINDLEPGIYQFRLKQVDFDGSHAYSPVVEVAVELPGAFILESAYPNPFNPSTTIRFSVKERQQVRLILFDLQGRHLQTIYEGIAEAGQVQSVSLQAGSLTSGTYVLRLIGDGFTGSQMITLIK